MKQQTENIFMDETQSVFAKAVWYVKKRREISCYFCRCGRTYVVKLAKGFGGPNLKRTEMDCDKTNLI